MAPFIPKISSVERIAPRPIIKGSLKPSQKALLGAWRRGQLPISAQRFMDLVRAGTQKTGRSRDVNKVTASQIPERLACQLAALSTHEGVSQFAASLLYKAPAAGHVNLQALANRAVLPRVDTQKVSVALNTSVAENSPASLMRLLAMLPYKVAQSILDERNAAINEFLRAWTEDLALNAELDAKAAKKAAETAQQAQLTQRRANELARANTALNIHKQAVAQANRTLDATSASFGKALLKQRIAVLNNTLALAGGVGVVTEASLVEQSLNGAVRSDHFVAQLAPTFNVATLDALDIPEDDLGPRLGFKRGRQGILG